MPIAVPMIWEYVVSTNRKMFPFRTILKRLLKMVFGKSEILALFMASMQASVPSSCGMFVYRLDTSIVTKMVLGGNGFDSRMAMIWPESLT